MGKHHDRLYLGDLLESLSPDVRQELFARVDAQFGMFYHNAESTAYVVLESTSGQQGSHRIRRRYVEPDKQTNRAAR